MPAFWPSLAPSLHAMKQASLALLHNITPSLHSLRRAAWQRLGQAALRAARHRARTCRRAYLKVAGASGAVCMTASILSSTSGVSFGSTSSALRFSATCPTRLRQQPMQAGFPSQNT